MATEKSSDRPRFMSGAEIAVDTLIEEGVDLVFGYPGGTILNIYDELYKMNGKIKHYLTAHEQGAAHAADAPAGSNRRAARRLF